MNDFEKELSAHGLALKRAKLQTLQINVGRKCNQTCRHCHVDAAPWRTEMMPEPVARRVGEWIRQHRPPIVDITGGAPELSDHFRCFVETARDCDSHIIDRNNLTIIETAAFAWLPEYLAAHKVEVVASLPCYLETNVNAQRGDGVFEICLIPVPVTCSLYFSIFRQSEIFASTMAKYRFGDLLRITSMSELIKWGRRTVLTSILIFY